MSLFYKILINHPIIPAFLLMNVVVGYWAHRRARINSFEDYASACNALPMSVLVMTILATCIDSGELHLPGLVALFGVVKGVEVIMVFLAFLLTGNFIASKLANFHGSITLGDLMGVLYGRGGQLIGGLIGFIVAFILIVSQMRAMGSITVYLLEMDHSFDPFMTIVCFGSLIVVYSVWGGIRAVSYTDVFQMMIAFIVFSWIVKRVIQDMGGISMIFSKIEAQHPDKLKLLRHPDFLYHIRRTFFWDFAGTFSLTLPIFQRMLMEKDKRKIYKMWQLSGCLYFLLGCMLVLIGLSGTIDKTQDIIVGEHKNLLLFTIKGLFEGHSWLIDVIFVGLLGILFSTADSFLHAMGITLVHDVLGSLRSFLNMESLAKDKKVLYARISIVFVGVMAIWLSSISGASLLSLEYHKYAVHIYPIVLGPLLFGIIGLKTDVSSWIYFCVCYIGSGFFFYWLEWDMYDYFPLCLLFGALGYGVMHVYKYKGFLIVNRTRNTVSEENYALSWQCIKNILKRVFISTFYVPCLGSREMLKRPMHPLAFSFVIFSFYTFSSFLFSTDGSHVEISNFITGVGVTSVMLCCGLMMQDIWIEKLKPYFPCYWMFTLFYCLPFSGTLIFLRTYRDILAITKWIGCFVILAFLVNRNFFVFLSFLGVSLAIGVWYVVMGSLPDNIWSHIGIAGWYGLLGLVVCVLLFSKDHEKERDRLYWQRMTNSRLSNDEITDPLQMLGGVGYVLQNAFSGGKAMKDVQGEEGFWIQRYQYQFLDRFASKMTEKSKEGKKDLAKFKRFIERHILSAFEQKEASIRYLVEKGIKQTDEKYLSKVEVTFMSKDDFKSKVLTSVFPNTISNIVENAVLHGRASKIQVKMDRKRREVRIRDNGIGIPCAILPYIFELRYSNGKESGVGLPFLRMVVEAAEGRVHCYSKYEEEDSFTELVIMLP